MAAHSHTHPEDGEAAHDHGHEDELFPRLATADLVAQAEASRERRESVQTLVIAVGLAILALGLPDPRVLPSGIQLVEEAGRAASPNPSAGLGRPCAGLLDVARASRLPARRRVLRRFATVSASTGPLGGRPARTGPAHRRHGTIAAPAAWLGGTTSGLFAPSLLGASVLLAALFPQNHGRTGGSSRPTLLRLLPAALLALALDPAHVFLLPVAALAWRSNSLASHRHVGVPALVLTAVLLFLATGSVGQFGRALAYLPLALGVLLYGVLSLFLGTREPEESPPPAWLLGWCVLGLASAAGAASWADLGFAAWIPAGAVGLGDLAARTTLEGDARRRALTRLGLQLGLVLISP